MNEESLKKRIRALLEEIKGEADPVLLNRCRSIFRKEVSFFHRSYMAAYLLLQAEGVLQKKSVSLLQSGYRNRHNFQNDRLDHDGKSLNADQIDKTETLQTLSEDESVQLFISIGRNRKVFPREILALVNAKAKIARGDIGMIRILDNYSFIQVRNSAADIVIRELNGLSFRGRTLTVNYARGRRDNETELSDYEEMGK